MKFYLVDTSTIFIDSIHVKANANNKKMRKRIAPKEALWFEESLKTEINQDRRKHGKKELKKIGNRRSCPRSVKEQKRSTTDPESGWFHKGEHKSVFAYSVETACDRHGWVLGFTVHPGNEHDSRTFKTLYDKIKKFTPEMIAADSAYKTPAIAKLLIDDKIKLLFPYKRPMTKEGFFKKNEYVYDEYYDCYLCLENKILTYNTTNRDGYREYKSSGCTITNHRTLYILLKIFL